MLCSRYFCRFQEVKSQQPEWGYAKKKPKKSPFCEKENAGSMIDYQVWTLKCQEYRQDIKGAQDKIEKVPLLKEGDDM